MVTKHFRLEDLRAYAIQGFTDYRTIRRVIEDGGGNIISDRGEGATRRLIYVAPHSLHAELSEEFDKFERRIRDNVIRLEVAAPTEAERTEAIADAVERLAALPDPVPNYPTSTIYWRSIMSDSPKNGPIRMVFYASEDGHIVSGFSDQIAVGRVWWAEKPLGPKLEGPPIAEVLDAVQRGDAEVASVKLSWQPPGVFQVSGIEFGWLIEHRDSQPSAPLYFVGFRQRSNNALEWSYNDAFALRFSRQRDAKAMLPLFAETHRVAEHGWDTRPAEAVKPVG